MTCLFFSQFLNAKVLKDDFFFKSENSYSFSEVCKTLTNRESPLIEKVSADTIDCMGLKKNVIEFCDLKESDNVFLARAYIDEEKKSVKCRSGRSVIFKWKCEGKNDRYCKDADIGCFLVKEKLARNLKLNHKALDKKSRTLSCYFDLGKMSID